MNSHFVQRKGTITFSLIAILAAGIFLSSCNRLSPASLEDNGVQQASARIAVAISKIGKLSKQKSISLQHLVLTISCSDEDTIRDTINLSGIGGSSIDAIIGNLAAPKQWRVAAATYDQNDSCIHSGSTSFITVPADTVNVAMNLVSKYSMLQFVFNGVPDSALVLSVSLDGSVTIDTVLRVAGSADTVLLAFDYLSAASDTGIKHLISMRARGVYYGVNTILYSADTTIPVISGEDKKHLVTLQWVGPYINNPPVITSYPSDMLDSVYAGSTYRDTVHANDADDDAVRFFPAEVRQGLVIANDSIIQWTTTPSDIGSHVVEMIARDGNGGYDTLEWTIRVIEPPVSNHAPVFSSLPSDMHSQIFVDSTYCDTVHATDANDDKLSFILLNPINGMIMVDSIIFWVAANDNIGVNTVTVVIDDGNGGKDTLTWNIQVTKQPQFPFLPFDSVITGEIDPAIDVDQYLFNGTAGDLITLRVDPENTGYPASRIQGIAPNDSLLGTKIVYNGNLNEVDFYRLPFTGQYSIRVMEAEGDQTFNYEIGLSSRLHSRTNGTTLEFGTPVNGTLVSRLSINSYIFHGNAGDKINLRVDPENTGYPASRIMVIAPDDSVLVNKVVYNGNLNAVENYELPATGQYIIQVMEAEGDQVFNYEIVVYSMQHSRDNGTTLEYGTPVTDTISSRTAINSYLFNGTAGDRVTLRLDPEDTGYPASRIQVFTPDGSFGTNVVYNAGLNAVENFELPATGQYIIQVMEAEGDQVFIYSLILIH